MSGRTLLVGGRLVDPANNVDGLLDLEIEDGVVTAVGPALSTAGAARVIDVSGRVVMPGVIDTHCHVSGMGPLGRNGHRMMARVGVTTAFDLSGEPGDLIDGLQTAGAGLNVVSVRGMAPGETIGGPDADTAEVDRFVARARQDGAIGIKCLGGHRPITPATLQRAIRAAHRLGAYVAVHCGTTTHGSDIDGLEEALDLAEGLPVHIAHINSYCRGQRTGDPLAEVGRALTALRAAPNARSESYLSALNGTGGACVDGQPVSEVTKTCLQMGGFAPTEEGLATAIAAGWARVWSSEGGETALIGGEEGVRLWRDHETRIGVSFDVNPPAAAIALALAREPDGSFTIDAISTDGGVIPRNTIVQQGLALVRFGALSLADFVRKASVNPAAMLGLPAKGQLGPGADADVTVLDLAAGRAALSLVGGEPVMIDGVVVGRGGTLLTTEAGAPSLRARLAADAGVRVQPIAAWGQG